MQEEIREAIVVLVGFLGAGKTTLLQRLVKDYIGHAWKPFIILNDYENAQMDAQRFLDALDTKSVHALSGSCICCSGLAELRKQINSVPDRQKGITFIEANGTADACCLMEFLGVGIKSHFLPPIQISVVDTLNWQKRGKHNELEASQVEVSSLVILNHLDKVGESRIKEVKTSILKLNPKAQVILWDDFKPFSLPILKHVNSAEKKFKPPRYQVVSATLQPKVTS